jgi:membrane protein YdbS with pleckstrin-like domain
VTDSFLSNLLASGEVVLIETRQHWVAAIRYTLRPIVILLIAAFLVLFNNWLGWNDGILGTLNQLILWVAVLLFVVSLVWLPIDLVRWWSRRYVLTSRRAMRMDGVLRKRSFDSSLEQINDIRTEQSFLGRTLGYADLTIYTASDAANEVYDQLLDGLQFKKAVLEAKEAIRAGNLLTELPEDFVVRGGTNEASIRKYGRAATPEPSPEAGTATATEAAPVAPAGVSAATAAAVMAASDVIEPSGEISSAAELAVPVELVPPEPAAAATPATPVASVAPADIEPAMPVVPGVLAPPAAVIAEPVPPEEDAAPPMVVEPVAEIPAAPSLSSEDEAPVAPAATADTGEAWPGAAVTPADGSASEAPDEMLPGAGDEGEAPRP